jgi:superoxide reductase
MAERFEVYKCDLCGNIVQVLVGGGGELVCCGEAMKKLTENTVDAAKEKHVPVIEKVDGGYKVKVGGVPHPMEEKHWIQWIELNADGKSYFQFLEPGQTPEAVFKVDAHRFPQENTATFTGCGKRKPASSKIRETAAKRAAVFRSTEAQSRGTPGDCM